MTLDTLTLMFVTSLVAVLCGLLFILNTSFNRNDPSGRVWSLAFIAGIITAVGYGTYAGVSDAWWGVTVANVSMIFVVGSLWSGARLYNGRRSGFAVVILVAAAVLVVSLVQVPIGEWAGSVSVWIGIAVLGTLGGLEALRARLRRNLNGRMLGTVLWGVAIFMGLRSIVFVLEGPHGDVFEQYFSTGITSIVNMALIIIATVSVSVLRAERTGGNAVGDLAVGINSAAGVLSAAAFRQAAADHIERAAPGGLRLALVGADIDRLPELNTAFGREAGDGAIAGFAATLGRTVPPMALIGHPGAGRFLILAPAASVADERAIAGRIQTALVDEPLPASQQIRLTASFGIADTDGFGHDLGRLTDAVGKAIDAVKLSGGNDIAAREVPA